MLSILTLYGQDIIQRGTRFDQCSDMISQLLNSKAAVSTNVVHTYTMTFCVLKKGTFMFLAPLNSFCFAR